MPSPLGHALAGLAAGWLVTPKGLLGRARTEAALFAAAGMAADLDLLVGAHSGPTHGLGAALIAGCAAAAIFAVPRGRGAAAVGVAAAYATHTLLDWLGSDSTPPIGIMALWPFSRSYYESSLHLFSAISRRYWQAGFWWHNTRAVVRELLLLTPAVAAAWWFKRRT